MSVCKRCILVTCILFVFFSLLCLNSCYLEKINEVPDFTQTDVSNNNGGIYCGPTSVSNSFMWLDDNGFGSLVSNSGNRTKDQNDLIIELASAAYMDTDDRGGTGAQELMIGVENYVLKKGYSIKRLAFQGWRRHLAKHSTGVEIPRLAWIKSGVNGTGSVWLNLGWYKYNPQTDVYDRKGGHWVTLVGYTESELIIHDPAPRSDPGANEYVMMERIQSGTLSGPDNYYGIPRDAAGYLKTTQANSMPINTSGGADMAIIDGAVVLEIN